jgi:FkbM family methyltransferase
MKKLYNIRRWLLMNFVPEIVWKKYVIFDGAKIPLRGMQYTFGVKWVLSKGVYEDSERVLIKKILKEGDLVLEMGGSIGVVTSIISNLIGNSGKVISIEASQKLADQTKSWIEKNGNVKVLTGFGFPVHLVPEKYKSFSFKFDGNSLGGYIDFDENKNIKSTEKIYDLSKIENDFNFKPSTLILDIEGSEIVILEPNIILPEYILNIVIEMHPDIYGQEIEDEIISKLNSLGFIYKVEINHVFLLSKNVI